METVLTYAMDQAYTSSRRALLTEFRSSEEVQRLIDRGVEELEVLPDPQTVRLAVAAFGPSGERRYTRQVMIARPCADAFE
jgi:hypothetical protein